MEGCIHLPDCDLDRGDEPHDTCTEETYDYSFHPDFFAGQVHDDGSMTITIQRGGYRIGESDGLVISVPDYAWVAEHLVADPDSVLESEMLAVVPLEELDGLPVEERLKASVYLNHSCPSTEASFTEGVGRIWFFSMYQNTELGDPRNEPQIHLGFELSFVDPFPLDEPGPDSPRLDVRGEARFDYERGTPAQPFP
jgi:hypothetical protein